MELKLKGLLYHEGGYIEVEYPHETKEKLDYDKQLQEIGYYCYYKIDSDEEVHDNSIEFHRIIEPKENKPEYMILVWDCYHEQQVFFANDFLSYRTIVEHLKPIIDLLTYSKNQA